MYTTYVSKSMLVISQGIRVSAGKRTKPGPKRQLRPMSANTTYLADDKVVDIEQLRYSRRRQIRLYRPVHPFLSTQSPRDNGPVLGFGHQFRGFEEVRQRAGRAHGGPNDLESEL